MWEIDRQKSRKSASSAELIWPSYGIRSLAAVRPGAAGGGRGGAGRAGSGGAGGGSDPVTARLPQCGRGAPPARTAHHHLSPCTPTTQPLKLIIFLPYCVYYIILFRIRLPVRLWRCEAIEWSENDSGDTAGGNIRVVDISYRRQRWLAGWRHAAWTFG